MPVADQDHGRVPVAVAIALRRAHELFHLRFREVLARAQLRIWAPLWHNCSFFGGWGDQLEVRFSHLCRARG